MYRKKYILVIMIFNICFAQNWLQNQRLERQFKEAISSYNEGRYATSETILNDIISLDYESYNEQALLLLLKSQIALNISLRYIGISLFPNAMSISSDAPKSS